MKITCVSDLHGNLVDIPECDVLVIAGDICPYHHTEQQRAWLDVAFRHWLSKVPAREVVGIAGNHDWIFQTRPEAVPEGLRWHYLQDGGIELFGLRFYGSPWQPIFYNWAFNLDEAGLEEKFSRIPEGTDVVMTHGPPFGIGDYCGDHVGSPALREHLFRVRPQLSVCGHIHGGWGVQDVEGVTFVNAALVNERYVVVRSPLTFDIEVRRGT